MRNERSLPLTKDEVASEIFRLIQSSPSSPDLRTIESFVRMNDPRHVRNMLLPGLMSLVGDWNKDHPEHQVEGDIRVECDGALRAEVWSKPRHFDMAYINPRTMRKEFKALVQSLMPKLDK